MKKILLITLLFLASLKMQSQSSVFDAILKTHVDKKGNVDYIGLKKNKAFLDVYLQEIENTVPGKKWSSNKAKAFWLNVYNAYTLKLILDTYPLSKLTDIKRNGKTAWQISFVKVGKQTYTLDYIEHKVLRRWHDDPRIHVGLNAASTSGPGFVNFVFTEENIDAKLDLQMKRFINNGTKNKITLNKLELSKVFKWYQEDFTHKRTLIQYINKYSIVKANDDAVISYLDYDWTLNDKK